MLSLFLGVCIQAIQHQHISNLGWTSSLPLSKVHFGCFSFYSYPYPVEEYPALPQLKMVKDKFNNLSPK